MRDSALHLSLPGLSSCPYCPWYHHPLQLLFELAEQSNLRGKINAMFNGEHINSTEDRAVLHIATRAHRNQVRRACSSRPPRPPRVRTDQQYA